METFFKRYFWTATLAAVVLTAFLLGKSVSNVVGTLLIPKGGGPITIHKPAPGPKARIEKSEYVQKRDIFNSAPKESDEPAADDTVAEADLNPDEVPESNLNVYFLGAIFDPAFPERSIVIVADGSTNRLFQIGQQVKPDAKLVQIWADHARVRRSDGRIEKLKEKVPGGGKAGKGKYGSSSASSQSKASGSASKSKSSAIKDGIRRKGSDEYEIDRAMLEEQLSDLNKLGTQARIIPHYKDGKAGGFKLVGIRPGSLYSHIGIRSGDVVKGVNGMELNSPTKALQIYEKLKTVGEITVDIERRGQKRTLTYNIK
jgi:general secretion pathway protein C